jgi:hypothetical protein
VYPAELTAPAASSLTSSLSPDSMRPEVYPHLLARFKAVAAKFGLVWEALR